MEEVIAHPGIDHGRLGRDSFDRGMRVNACSMVRSTVIAGAQHPHAAIIAGDIFDQPGHSVIGIGLSSVTLSERSTTFGSLEGAF